jgi:hypothetical protein
VWGVQPTIVGLEEQCEQRRGPMNGALQGGLLREDSLACGPGEEEKKVGRTKETLPFSMYSNIFKFDLN